MESRDRHEAVAHPSASSGLASGGRDCGRAAVRREGRADGWGYPVSDRVRERERAQGAGSARAGLGQSQAGRPKEHSVCFLFSFMQNYDVCLILYNKLCADPKIIKIFV